MTNPFDQTDPFTASGGSGAPAVTFPEIGATFTGVVTKVDELPDKDPQGVIKTWDDGNPKKVFVFTCTDDTGEQRSLWVRGNMVKAIREAVATAGVPTVIGNKIKVKHHALGEAKKGFAAPKLYQAKIEKLAPVAPATPVDDDF